MEIKPDEITRALRILFAKDDVFEIRVLNAVTVGSNGYPHTESGYFDYHNIESVPRSLEHIKSCSGVYVVLNPVLPELLSRCANRIIKTQKGASTTTDGEITRRRWGFIDLDPVRVSGIASTNDQHEQALGLALEISVGMKKCGFEEPVIFDSGNGAHVLYAIDMPTDDNGLMKRFLAGIGGSWTGDVEIDTAVFNPARLIRLPGTMNCKGDSTAERPHRMATIYHVPETINLTEASAFESLALKEEVKPTANVYHNTDFMVSEFNIDEWITKHCPDVDSPISYNGGRKWLFQECPFNPEHKHGDAAIIQLSNGAIDFKCFHNHCQQYDWHSLRDLREPGWREKRTKRDDSDVNLGGILNPAIKIEMEPQEVYKEKESVIPFPRHLLNIGGLIGKVMATTMEYAPVPNAPLALAGALNLMSFLTARKVKTESGLRSNIYILGLAQSGSGKDFPRSVNRNIMQEIGAGLQLVDNIGSGEGLEDYMVQNPALLWQCDEFYSVLKTMACDKPEFNNSLMRYLLILYTSANAVVNTRLKAGKQSVGISNPHLSLFATTTPTGFLENISSGFLNDGMFARMNIIIADKPARPQLKPDSEISDELKQLALNWFNYTPAGSGNLNPNAAIVPYSVSGRERANELLGEQYDLCEAERNSADCVEWRLSLWNRYFEIAMRYALLYACSEASNPEDAVITAEAVQWAAEFVKWDIENKIRMVDTRYYRSDFEKTSETIVEILSKWHKQHKLTPMPSRQFNIKTKFIDLRSKSQAIEALILQGRLIRETIHTGGRPMTIFALPEFYASMSNGA